MSPGDHGLVLTAAGLGMLWQGLWILLVGRLPRALRGARRSPAEPGSPQAFTDYWLDQYSWIGLALVVVGMLLTAGGLA